MRPYEANAPKLELAPDYAMILSRDALHIEGMAMPHGIASAKQLAMMARVLDRYCETYGITDPLQRDDTAALILELFNLGSRDEDAILAELKKRLR